VDAGIDLRVVPLWLGNAEQAVDLGQDHPQGAAVAQDAQKLGWRRAAQCQLEFPPDSLWREFSEFAPGGDLPHQAQGSRRDAKAKMRKQRREPRDPQRILAECRRDVPQDAVFQVGASAVWIDELAIDREAGMLRPGFALAPGQRVFLPALRVQVDRKFLADAEKAVPRKCGATAADHDPVALLHRKPEHPVANRAANEMDFHALPHPQKPEAKLYPPFQS